MSSGPPAVQPAMQDADTGTIDTGGWLVGQNGEVGLLTFVWS